MMQSKPKQIGVLGCGWLGKALAKELLLNHYKVKGTTTCLRRIETLEKAGIKAYQIQLKPTKVIGDLDDFLKGIETLILAVPPQFNKPETNLYQALKNVFKQYDLSNLDKLIYISSTAVFADGVDKIYDENSQPNNESPRGKHLIDLENLIKKQIQFYNINILRFGGLIQHQGRHPVHYLSGKEGITNPKAPVNLIEQKDAVGLIIKIIEKSSHLKIYHGVNPLHPCRKDYYIKKAETLNLKPPVFDETEISKGKILASDITQSELKFEYKSGI